MDKAKDFKGYNGIFATRLRGLMSEGIDGKKTTQQDLAVATGYTRQAISQYMDGSVIPNAEKLAVISKFFNVSADYLLGLSPNPTTDPEVKAICNYTGLSGEAVEALHFLSEGISSGNATTAFYTTDGKYIRAAPSKFVFEFINQEVVRFVRFLSVTM